jgi:hypothetical protein
MRVPGTESWTSYPSRTANDAAATAASKRGLVAAHRLAIVFDAPDTTGAYSHVTRYCHEGSPIWVRNSHARSGFQIVITPAHGVPCLGELTCPNSPRTILSSVNANDRF